jgi:hypothetical protein
MMNSSSLSLPDRSRPVKLRGELRNFSQPKS